MFAFRPWLITTVLCFACILFLPVAFVSTAWGQGAEDLKIVGFDYPPFYQERGGAMEGIAVELAQELFSRLKVEFTFSVFPLKRALSLLENGQADCTMILIRTSQRLKYLHFTEPIMRARGLIWSAADRKGSVVNYETLEDLKQYKIGVTLGYSYGPEFDRMLKTMNVDIANSDYSNLLKVLEHRIDIFPGNEFVVEGIMEKYPELRAKLVRSDKAFFEWDLRIAISRKSQYSSMLPEIEGVLSDLKRDGVVSKIVGSYLH
jgi:polar amino acid transport system substrate-binding protein